jgi:hypothetical protein
MQICHPIRRLLDKKKKSLTRKVFILLGLLKYKNQSVACDFVRENLSKDVYTCCMLNYVVNEQMNIFLGSQETKRAGGTVGRTDSRTVRGSFRPGIHQP